MTHVVVIGAGLYGAAVAAGLARRGARVTVVDGGAPGQGTSGATFSWINSCGRKPEVYHRFAVAGVRAHRRLAASARHGDWYHETGDLAWATDPAQREKLRRKVADGLAQGEEVRWLSRAEALRLEPGLDPDRLPAEEIAYFPREGWIEPARLIGHLLAYALTRGGELVRDDPVTGLEVAGDLVRAVRLACGRRLPADAVVNCAGPQAARIAELAGLALPMRNTHGVVICTSPVAVWISHVVHAPDVHLRPDGGGRLLLHAPRIDGPADAVLAAASALYPALTGATVESVRAGERPIPADGLPVLGRARTLPNFHFAVSHSGATLSVHAGDLVAAEALGIHQDTALAAFRFERFLPRSAR
ncbi:FAD-binding oxidoreductase [Spongiactinospora rosea]|uniref:FAD-binding oxidoreductase n=1 Tax=Spongiactinospora rosea TaxID=2248750 RepID=A0A366LNT8_9ACTN|nr:FAD-dependent oxidoreductase [Spongiactinospora rosea]RBQ14954.1 FAD-binding oxidoreductase [Spongiactinospora rosea]